MLLLLSKYLFFTHNVGLLFSLTIVTYKAQKATHCCYGNLSGFQKSAPRLIRRNANMFSLSL